MIEWLRVLLCRHRDRVIAERPSDGVMCWYCPDCRAYRPVLDRKPLGS